MSNSRGAGAGTNRILFVVGFAGVCWWIFSILSTFHVHGWKNFGLALALTALLFGLGRPLIRRIAAASRPTRRDWRDPRLGSRAERRRRARGHK